MATKTKTKAKTSTKAKQGRGTGQRRGRPARPSKAAALDVETTAVGADSDGSTRDQRIPPLGTIIKKVNRHGELRCECKVVEGGFEYNGATYPSLSAAAMAAAKVLKLTNKTQNGFAFWALGKPADLLTTLEQAWRRYETKAAALVKRAADDTRSTVAEALRRHAQAIERFIEEMSE